LIIGDGSALRRGQDRHIALGNLMQFTTLAPAEFLIVDGRRPYDRLAPGGFGRFWHELS
jgi:hypothetical protein